MKISITMLILVLASGVPAQDFAPAPVHQIYLGELHTFDKDDDDDLSLPFDRGTIRVDLAGAAQRKTDLIELVVGGMNRIGRPWQVRTEFYGGLGFTEAWQADLDGNGTLDLILVHATPINGRCVDRTRMTTLLFDSDGNPATWEVESYFDVEFQRDGGRGVLDLLDLNHNGRAENIHTDCDFAENYGKHEAVAIYEVSEQGWSRLPELEERLLLLEYERGAAKRRGLAIRAGDPNRFEPDYSNTFSGNPKLTIGEFVPREPRRPVTLPPARDNRIIEGPGYEAWAKNERQVTADRWLLSDGTTCYGLPSVIIDRLEGRLVVLQSTGRTGELLQKIMRDKWPVALAGQTEADRCSPAWLWAKQPE